MSQTILTLITALLGGLIAAVATYVFTSRREHIFFMRKKAEELYLAMYTFDRRIVEQLSIIDTYLDGKCNYAHFCTAFLEAKKDTQEAQAMMLCAIYFPTVEVHFNALRKLTFALKVPASDVDSDPYQLPKYEALKLDYFRHSVDAKRELIICSRAVATFEALWPNLRRPSWWPARKMKA